MTDAFTSSSEPIVIHQTFRGLPYETPCHLRALPWPTVLSLTNRLLKPEFPIQRDHEVYLQLVNKGLASPQTSRQNLASLPLFTLESLGVHIFQASLSNRLANQVTGLDLLLSLIIAVEEARQFELDPLVAEDLAMFEDRQPDNLHEYYFKDHQKPELYAHVLESQGYRSDLLNVGNMDLPAPLLYWLCRRLSVIPPWTAILAEFTHDQAETFPYLERLRLIADFVKAQGSWDLRVAPEKLLKNWLPQVNAWLDNEFRGFSQQAGIPRPVETLILVEGNTEFLLIPVIAAAMGYNLDAEGILVQSVGGKNQMLQQYVNSAEHLAVPICIVLDRDAAPMMPDLKYYQREGDRIFLLEEGEFEDLYDLELVVKTVNRFYQPTHALSIKAVRELAKTEPNRVKLLQTLWQTYGLGPFDKVSFAQRLVEAIQAEEMLKGPMTRLVNDLIEARRHHEPPLSS